MAFDSRNANYIAGPLSGGFGRLWSYVTDDSEATITTAGYFVGAAASGLRNGDVILVCNTLGTASLTVSMVSVSSGTAVNTGALEDIASQAEAEALTDNVKRTTVLRVAQEIPAYIAARSAATAIAGTPAGADSVLIVQGGVPKLAAPSVISVEKNLKRDYGAAFDASADDTAQWNSAHADINSGTIRWLEIPSGTTVVSSAPTSLIASDWGIRGHGAGATKVQFKATAGTAGTLFHLGSAVAQAENVTISDLYVEHLNTATLDGTQNTIYLENTLHTWIKDIRVESCNGFIRFGNADNQAQRTKIQGIEGRMYGPAGGTFFDVQYASNIRCLGARIGETGNSLTTVKALHCHPTANNVVDAATWLFEVNVPNDDIDTLVLLDATNGKITNWDFIGTVNDHSVGCSIKLLIDSGALAGARISRVKFIGVRCTPDDNGSVIIDNTGDGRMNAIQFLGGFFHMRDKPAFQITHGTNERCEVRIANTELIGRAPAWATDTDYVIAVGSDQADQVVQNSVLYVCQSSHHSVTFATDLANGKWVAVTPFAAIQSNRGSIQVIGNRVAVGNVSSELSVAKWGVQFTNNSDDFQVIGNDFTAVLDSDVDTSQIQTGQIDTTIIANNLAPRHNPLRVVSTTDATQTTLAILALKDERTYNVSCIVIGIKDDGSAHATYKLEATVSRTGAGNTVLDSVMIDARKTDSTWGNATIDASTTNARVRVTGKVATNINWGLSDWRQSERGTT